MRHLRHLAGAEMELIHLRIVKRVSVPNAGLDLDLGLDRVQDRDLAPIATILIAITLTVTVVNIRVTKDATAEMSHLEDEIAIDHETVVIKCINLKGRGIRHHRALLPTLDQNHLPLQPLRLIIVTIITVSPVEAAIGDGEADHEKVEVIKVLQPDHMLLARMTKMAKKVEQKPLANDRKHQRKSVYEKKL